jgi:large subunit ribosomal protein L22e/Meckel syndrome type 1 protein
MLFALAALAAGCTLASSAPAMAAAAKNYDCSKAGNANKAVCKNGSKDAIKGSTRPKDAKAEAPKAAATKPVKTEAKATPAKADAKAKPAVATAATERHYDCTKAGNANKAACKGAAIAAAAKPAPKPIAKSAAKPAAMPKSVSAPKATPAAASTENSNPAGAIAQCKDGSYSHAKAHTGACSRHGGVGKWLG